MPADRKDIPTIDSSDLRELTDKLMTACHILDHEGVTDGYGHIGVRVPGADAFITIANISPGCVTRDRLIMQDFDGNYLDGAKTPPNEWPIHACIFKARPEIVSVAHTHSKWSTIFSVLPIKLKPMHHYGKFLSADGPPIYQGIGLVRTVERGNEFAAALRRRPGGITALPRRRRRRRKHRASHRTHDKARHARRVESSRAAPRRAALSDRGRVGSVQCRPTFPHARLGVFRQPAARKQKPTGVITGVLD